MGATRWDYDLFGVRDGGGRNSSRRSNALVMNTAATSTASARVFCCFSDSSGAPSSKLVAYSRDGAALGSATVLAAPRFGGYAWSSFADDPQGGGVALRTYN